MDLRCAHGGRRAGRPGGPGPVGTGDGCGLPRWRTRPALASRERRCHGSRSGAAVRDPVADPGSRLDDVRLSELAPQPADRDLHGLGERVGVLVPDLLEQLLGAERRPGWRAAGLRAPRAPWPRARVGRPSRVAVRRELIELDARRRVTAARGRPACGGRALGCGARARGSGTVWGGSRRRRARARRRAWPGAPAAVSVRIIAGSV